MEIAELFDATKQNISLHLKNVFEDGELDSAATVKQSLTVQTEGTRQMQRPVTLYNLDAILAVGYRVRSPRGVQFRRWASTILKEFREQEARYSRRVEMAEIEKNDFNLNISRYISTAVGEEEIDLDETQQKLVEIEKAIAAAKDKHNAFLRELGLKPLP